MTPLGGEPAVVVVQPPDHGTDVEGAIDGVKLEGGAGDLATIGNDGALDDGAEQLGAFLEAETLETAAESVEEDPAGSVKLSSSTSLSASVVRCLGRFAGTRNFP